jgi:hypothetical protein
VHRIPLDPAAKAWEISALNRATCNTDDGSLALTHHFTDLGADGPRGEIREYCEHSIQKKSQEINPWLPFI